jgi:RNA polymerase sigma-70 factor (ECF subfamily)
VKATIEAEHVADPKAVAVGARVEPAAAAFGRLADEHLDRAYGLAYSILRDRSNAQDATHDAFVQAWRKWSTLRDPDRFEVWFDRILVNQCRNRLTRASRQRTTDISDELAIAAGDPYAQTHDRDVIETALGRLSPDHRVIVALRYERDLTAEDIAARLGIPIGTVHSRLHYALRRLHDVVDDPDREDATR